MKKYNRLMAASLLIYLAMSLLLFYRFQDNAPGTDVSYKVEINQIMQGLESAGAFSEPDLRGMKAVKSVRFLSAEEESAAAIRSFYQNRNGMHMTLSHCL